MKSEKEQLIKCLKFMIINIEKRNFILLFNLKFEIILCVQSKDLGFYTKVLASGFRYST